MSPTGHRSRQGMLGMSSPSVTSAKNQSPTRSTITPQTRPAVSAALAGPGVRAHGSLGLRLGSGDPDWPAAAGEPGVALDSVVWSLNGATPPAAARRRHRTDSRLESDA